MSQGRRPLYGKKSYFDNLSDELGLNRQYHGSGTFCKARSLIFRGVFKNIALFLLLNDHYVQKAYANSNCSKSCAAVSFPAAAMSTMGSIPYCQSITDYSCLNIEMRKVLYKKVNKNCPKYCYILEYTGRRTFMLKTDDNTKYEKKWYYIFSSKEDVKEEYLLYDFTGFIGQIGGTLGLFIGFSFIHIIDMVLHFLKRACQTRILAQ